MDIAFTPEGDRRIMAALNRGPDLTPALRAQLAVEFADHLASFTAADTAEDVRSRTDDLTRDVWVRHGQPGVEELRRLAGVR